MERFLRRFKREYKNLSILMVGEGHGVSKPGVHIINRPGQIWN